MDITVFFVCCKECLIYKRNEFSQMASDLKLHSVCVCVCVCVVCVCVLRCSVFFHFQGIWRICFLFFACFDSLLKDGLLERILIPSIAQGDRSSTVVKALCYKSEGRWFDPSWCHWILH